MGRMALILALLGMAGAPAGPESRALRAHVDPRVELLSIIFRLAGNPEYNMDNSKSPYADAVQAHFGNLRTHPAVTLAQELRGRDGISFDAVMSLAVHVDEVPTLNEKLPFDQRPARLDARWKPDTAREFLRRARQFVSDSEFKSFLRSQRSFYEAAGQRMTEKLAERDYLQWFDAFFGTRPDTSYEVIVGLLIGGQNYGVGVLYPGGKEEISPVMGVYRFDEQGLPVFDDSFVPTLVHELTHSYTNPLVDKYEPLLEPAGKRLYGRFGREMERLHYGNWKTMIYESLVRACTARYQLANDTRELAIQSAKEDYKRGFKWLGDLVMLLNDYEADRQHYPGLDDFMPKVVVFFEQQAREYDPQPEAAPEVVKLPPPQVVSIVPLNGATDVDPKLPAIVVVFNQPMVDKSWSICGDGPHFPKPSGDVAYDPTCTILTIPVKLKPNWDYEFGLNCESFHGFKSAAGVELEPVLVKFKTKKK